MPCGICHTCKSVIMPPTETSVLHTAVYSSHELNVYYGLCKNSELPDTKIKCPTNETRTLKINTVELKCIYCNKIGHTVTQCYEFS